MEASSLKKKTTVLWPRRGRKGLRQHCCSIFRRLLQNAYRTYWVRELQQPRSFHSGPVRRGVSAKKQDKSSGAVGEQNSPAKESDMRSSDRFACYGRSRKNIVPVAYGGIKARDFFRPGGSRGYGAATVGLEIK